MAEQGQSETMLDAEIASVCEKLATLNKREKDITAATSDIDVVEKDILCRRIRAERRQLHKKLSELSVRKALIHNNVQVNDTQADAEDEEGDEDDNEGDNIEAAEAADVGELQVGKVNEYNRLNNMMEKVKSDVMNRRNATEKLINEDTSLLTDTERRSHEVKMKSSIRSL